MTDIMFDIETLGNEPNSVILEIAAIPFDRNNQNVAAPVSLFHEIIDPEDSTRYGLKINASTVGWWLKQDEDVRNLIQKAWVHGQPLKDVMNRLSQFYINVQGQYPDNEICVWGNGSGFDINLLEDAYRAALGRKLPWGFWTARDLRTLVDIADFDKSTVPFDGVAHNATADALHQVKIVFACLSKLGKLS